MSFSQTAFFFSVECLFLLTLLLVTSVEAQELHGFFSSSFTQTRSEVERTITELESWRQSGDLNWNRSLSPSLSYRIGLRGERLQDRSTEENGVRETSSLLLQPALDLTLALPRYSLHTGVRLRELLTDGNREEEARLSDRNFFARLSLNPIGFLPVSFLVDRSTSVDDRHPQARDSKDTRYQVSTQYTARNFNLFYSFSHQATQDNILHQNRNQQNHIGSLGYRQQFFQGRLSLQGNYFANYTRTGEEFLTSGTVEVPQELQRGLRADADLTPLDSTDVPLREEPALLTGTADIPLLLFTAAGFALRVEETVQEIVLSLTPEPPFRLPSNLDSLLTLRVFFSNDTALHTWEEVSAVSQQFDDVESQLILRFPPVTARFFKIYVERNDLGELVRINSILARDIEPVTAGTKRVTSTLLHKIGAGLTAQPFKATTLSYNFSLTDTTQEPDAVRDTSGVHTASLTVEPHRLLKTTFTYQHNFDHSNRSGSKDKGMDIYSLILHSNPLPTLSSSLSFVRNENRSAGELQSRNDTASFNAATELYRNLNVDLTYSFSRLKDFSTSQDTQNQLLSVNLNARLTARLNATLGYSFRQTRAESPVPGRTTTSHTASGAFTYTPSRFLNFNARFDLSDTIDGNTFSQQYRLDWTPTARASLFINYRRMTQQIAGDSHTSHFLDVNGRWNISRYFDLSANYTLSQSGNADRIQSFFTTLGFRF